MTTGIFASAGSACRRCNTPQPSSCGIKTSSVMTDGLCSLASFRPSSPDFAVITSKPSLARKRRIRSRAVTSSSITRTVLPPVAWAASTTADAGAWTPALAGSLPSETATSPT